MKPTILILAALLLAPRPAQSVEVPVWPRQQVAPATTAPTEAPSSWGGPSHSPTVPVAKAAGPAQSVSGIIATWYCLPGRSRCTVGYPASCLCAAASRDLHLRGKRITVTYRGRNVTVRVIDCLCSRAGGLDLYASAWERLAPLGLGEITVTFR